ncbi:hypothetical protein WJU16_22800 [Chitinophaga pollutisoli]|uniref:DUF4136 domain-containing protein n=1 Tax=Chitinophaga pollutisoli TaxID=3133966 RepID=A0ABZ2YM08_9BACT
MKQIWLFMAVAMMLPSCYSTQLTGYRQSPAGKPVSYKKILVLGMMPDSALRQRMESHVAGDLTDAGITAVTSFQGFDAFEFLKTEDKVVSQQFTERGIDAVLTISLVNKTTEGAFLPASLYHLLTDQYANEYYWMLAPELQRLETQYAWESSLYDVAEGMRVFAIQSVTFDPASHERMAHEYGKVLTRELFRRKIISRPK